MANTSHWRGGRGTGTQLAGKGAGKGVEITPRRRTQIGNGGVGNYMHEKDRHDAWK